MTQVDDDPVPLPATGPVVSPGPPVSRVPLRAHQVRAVVETLLDPWVLLQAVRAGDGTIVDFEYADANEAACRSNGIPYDRLIGSRVGDVFPDLATSGMIEAYASVVRTGQPLVRDDVPFANPRTGASGFFDDRGVRLGDGLSLTWRDVTDRHRTVAELADSRDRYRLLAQNASDVVFRGTAEGRLDWVSPSVSALLGWAAEDLVGRSCADVAHPDDVARVLTAQQAAHDGRAQTFEFRCRRADGGFRWLSARIRPVVAAGDLPAVVGGWRDIQAEVDSREALARSEELFRTAMANAAVSMCLVDPGGGFLAVNPALCEFLGRDATTLTRSTWQELTHPDDLDADLALVADVLTGRRDGYRLTKRFLRPDGTVVWGDLSVSCVRDSDGAVRHLISQISDITQMVHAREALARSQEDFRLLAQNAASVVSRMDNEGRPLWVSDSVTALLGWRPADLIGRPILDIVHPDDVADVRRGQRAALAGLPASFEMRARSVTGDYRWFAIMLSPFRDPDGRVAGRVAGWRDIQAEVEAAAALEASEEHFRLLAENSTDIVFRTAPDLRLEWVSPSVTEMLGWHPAELVGKPVVVLLDPRDIAAMSGAAADARATGAGQFEARMLRRDGSGRWMAIAGRAITDEAGAVVGRVGRARDIQAEHEARDALERSEERFRTAMESAPIGMATVDLGRRFTQVNPALCAMLDVSPAWLLRRTLGDVLHPEDDRSDLLARYDVQDGRTRHATGEARLLRPDGRIVWVQHAIGLVQDGDGEPLGFVSSFADVTEARAARTQLQHLATRDPLTDLANRRELFDRFTRLLDASPMPGAGVLFIDLDGLKPLNDAYGHVVGDQVIVEVARRIRDRVPDDGIVARFGGDEYVAILPAVSDTGAAAAVAEAIQRSASQPVDVGGLDVPISLSIGVALASSGEDPEEALRRADVALYEAKRSGRARTVVYRPEFDPHRPR